MTTLTETRIDIADRHTTLCPFAAAKNKKKITPRLAFGTEESYTDLYRQADQKKVAYASLNDGKAGMVLDKIFRVYGPERYWKKSLGFQSDPSSAWAEGLPLQASIAASISISPPSGFTAKISPVPQVLLYPFGWSTWISLLIVEEHTLEGLAQLVGHLFNQQCFNIEGVSGSKRLQGLLDDISKDIRTDVFCGTETKDSEANDKAIVTTVLAKHGGAPALGALSQQDQKILKRMVRPAGPETLQPFEKLVFKRNELNYVVYDQMGRFIWLDQLLSPEGRNHQNLECHHNNSFRALVQAWQLEGLLSASAGLRLKQPAALQGLVAAARRHLEQPRFKNATLRTFLESNDVHRALHPNDKV
jgi:hypothetical protein